MGGWGTNGGLQTKWFSKFFSKKICIIHFDKHQILSRMVVIWTKWGTKFRLSEDLLYFSLILEFNLIIGDPNRFTSLKDGMTLNIFSNSQINNLFYEKEKHFTRGHRWFLYKLNTEPCSILNEKVFSQLQSWLTFSGKLQKIVFCDILSWFLGKNLNVDSWLWYQEDYHERPFFNPHAAEIRSIKAKIVFW